MGKLKDYADHVVNMSCVDCGHMQTLDVNQCSRYLSANFPVENLIRHTDCENCGSVGNFEIQMAKKHSGRVFQDRIEPYRGPNSDFTVKTRFQRPTMRTHPILRSGDPA
jgi:Zn ribbon nucleic-acid-binding protein